MLDPSHIANFEPIKKIKLSFCNYVSFKKKSNPNYFLSHNGL